MKLLIHILNNMQYNIDLHLEKWILSMLVHDIVRFQLAPKDPDIYVVVELQQTPEDDSEALELRLEGGLVCHS